MTEEKKTTKVASESKKTTATAKKKTTAKSTAKTKTPAKAEKEAKVFGLDTPVLCKSVRQNELYYVAKSGMEYVWNGFGDEREVLYGDIIALKSSRSPFLYEPWFVIKDEDLLERPEFKKDFQDMYALYEEFDQPSVFFDRPISEIKERLKSAPNGLRDLIVYNAGEYINDGTLDRIGVINAIDEVFGTNLKMLI